MTAISFEEALAAQRKKVGKRWFTGDEYRKATGNPTPVPFTKADTTKIKEVPADLIETFDQAVRWIQHRDSISRMKATETARREFPHLVNKLQAEADEALAKAEQDEDDEDDRKFARKAIQKPFLEKVEAIRTRDGLSHTAAMTKARKEHPVEFAEAYEDR